MKKCCVAALTLALCSALLGQTDAQYKLRGKHLAADLKCRDCHGVDTPEKRAPASRCKECHEDVKTESKRLPLNNKVVDVNVHASHQGELRCTLCHKVHSPSVLYCNDCHNYDIKVP